MTFAQLYRQCRQTLAGDTADFDLSQLFLAHFSGVPGLRFSEAEVPDDEAFVFRHKVRRLSEGYPLQYLLGEWEFYGIPVKVGPGVLIPRPDTETVVDLALELLGDCEAPVCADLCAGSGAIALALAKHRSDATVYAVELSEDALSYLKENVAINSLSDRITVIQGDVRGELELHGVDLIASNPPYLTDEEMEQLPVQVSYEPQTALRGGEDGLDFYRMIAKKARRLLKPGGWLLFEVGYRQADDVHMILAQNGFVQIGSRRDLGGIERCIFGRREV